MFKLPHVNSPFTTSRVFVGSKEIPISLALIKPLEKRLSVTVGMRVLVAGERVPVNCDVSGGRIAQFVGYLE